MSYHGSSSSSSNTQRQSSSATTQRQTTLVGVERQSAPVGYHYMPDGSLMADSEMDSTPSIQSVAPPGYHYMADGSLMADSEMGMQQSMVSCSYQDLANEAKATVASAYLGYGLPNANSQVYVNFFNNGFNTFVSAMWAGYLNGGCNFWTNRINHWTDQIANNNYNPYHLGRKQAKVLFAQNMHVACGCPGPIPPLAKVIERIKLDVSPLKAIGETRRFLLIGDTGATFSLEVKNEDNYYYNFVTHVFQAAKSGLYNEVVSNGSFEQTITFPTVTDDDQYDFYLTADPTTTKHANQYERRLGDGSLDINLSGGSNSLLITKVIYQYLDKTLTISPYSVGGTIEVASGVNDTIVLPRGSGVAKQQFSIACSVSTAAKCYRIIKQPASGDIISFVEPVVGSAPITIDGEDIYPAVNNTDIVDGTGFAAATVNKFVMNTNVADKMVVGDKITIATTDLTDTINGAVSSGVKVVMDSNVATKMAVGDRITAVLSGVPHAFLTTTNPVIVTVAALNPDGDNVKEFSMSQAVSVSDGEVLTFTPKCNRELFTVAALNPDEDNAKEFSYVDAAGGTTSRLGVMDNAVLSFSNQMNYQWPINNFAHILKEDMVVVPGTNVTASTSISKYEATITEFPGTKLEKIIITKAIKPISTLAIKPIITKGEVTTQEGAIVFNKQQSIALGGDTLKIGGYGESEILRVYGYDVILSDLAISLTPITTTTTAAVNNSTSIPVTSRNGILDDVSTVNGIGINPKLADPTVDTGAGAVTGAGTLVLTAAQTIENGATLTFPGAGQTATITGSIQVLKAGSASQTLRFDVDKLLSIT